MELLFDVQHPKKILDLEANKKEIPENAKRYYSLMDIGIEKMIGSKIFEFQICAEIENFKEEIKADGKIFSAEKMFPFDVLSANIEEKPNEIEKSFQEMNLFMESFIISDLNLIDIDFPDSTPEVNVCEENYDNHMVANEENGYVNEESQMNNVFKLSFDTN